MQLNLVASIERVIDAHRKVTGREITWREAARRLDRFGDAIGWSRGVEPWKTRAMCLLFEASYSDEAIREAIAWCDREGTALGCPVLDLQDQAEATELMRRGEPIEPRLAARLADEFGVRDVPDPDLSELDEAAGRHTAAG